MSFFSPSRNLDHLKKSEPVFKTPMSFSPRLVGDRARPSPSRVELWREELGLDGDSSSDEDLNSDDETEVDQNTNKLATCSAIEYESLQKELEERNSQRDELLYRVKTLNDKNKMYKQRLEREELTKKQQLKILRRTHDSQMLEKAKLITNLEAILDEHEMKINSLDTKGEVIEEAETGKSSLRKLITQIEELQSDKNNLLTQVETRAAEVENLHATSILESGKEDRLDELEQENKQLQEEVIKLRNIKSTGSTDAEKQACKLELQNDKLQNDCKQLTQQLAKLQAQTQGQSDTDNKIIKKLKEDNSVLSERLQTREAELAGKREELEETERRLKAEIKQLEAEKQASGREVRNLSARITALHAKSPDVVTKVQRVEIDSQETTDLLGQVSEERDVARSEIETLQEQLNKQTEEADRDRQKYQTEIETLQQQLSNKTGEADTDRQKQQTEITQLQQAATQWETEKGELEREVERVKGELVKTERELTMKVKEKECHLAAAEGKTEEVQKQLSQYEEDLALMHDQLEAEIQEVKLSKVAEVERVRRESAEHRARLETTVTETQDRLRLIEPAMAGLVEEYKVLKKQCHDLPRIIKQEVQITTRKLVQALSDISEHNQELVRKYRKEMALRKKYHNELVELKGNIRVFARVRPPIKEDGSGAQAGVVVDIDHDDDSVINVTNKGRVQMFEMDRAFNPDVSQAEVFSEVQALVTSCMDGYNVCIFAYGQTGSGKTFTMEGTTQDPGINQRALKKLFAEAEDRRAEWDISMTVSVIEIYNEMIRDLLSDDVTQKLEVKMLPEGGVWVHGLTSHDVTSVNDVNKVFTVGRKNRQTASTNMNERSSRSHALLCVQVVATNRTTGMKTTGKLNLVDLAGSERVSKSGADGDRLKEAQNINKSLSSLGDVIHALKNNQGHVPYRNSKLTYLLQDSLGGDSKTLMIVQVSPVEKNVGETTASLNFASRVKTVELGMASKKIESGEGPDTPNGRSNVKLGHSGSNSKLPTARRK